MNTNTPHTRVTVTTAPGRPTIHLQGHPDVRAIADIVREQFGYHLADAQVPALPHSFCASIFPTPEPTETGPREVGAFGHWGAALTRSQRRRQCGC
jgi:hypothetical protein